jgi:hypothetical protein
MHIHDFCGAYFSVMHVLLDAATYNNQLCCNPCTVGGNVMKTGIGAAVVIICLLLAGMGLTIGILLNEQPAPHEQQLAWEQRQLVLSQAQAQAAYEQQQHVQALENQRLYGEAFAWLIENGGIVLVCALAIVIVMYAASGAYRLATNGRAGTNRSQP